MRLTVEHFFYALIVLLAAAMRFFALGLVPLTAGEAQNAWAAWLAATGQALAHPITGSSALYQSVQTLIFLPAFSGDAVARFLPALLGVALVLLPWWWRAHIGQRPALILAGLLAIDPWLVAFSRYADGTIASIFLGLLLITALLNLLRTEYPELVDSEGVAETEQPATATAASWSVLAAIAAGLLVTSGPSAWNFVVLAAALIAILGVDQARILTSPRYLLVFAAAFLLAATGWLLRPAWMGTVSSSLTGWLAQLSSDQGYPLAWWSVRLIADNAFALAFGVIGIVVLFRHSSWQPERTAIRWLLLFWLIFGLVLGILPGRSAMSLPMIGLPLLFGAAFAVDALLDLRGADFDWNEGQLLLLILSVLALSGTIYSISALFNTTFELNALQPILLMIGLAILLAILYAVWLNARQSLFMIGCISGLLLVMAAISAGWRLNYNSDPTRVAGFFATVTDPDVRNLAADVATISAQRKGDPAVMPLVIELGADEQPNPVLGWYLRKSQNVSWSPGAGVDVKADPAPLLIARGNDEQASVGTVYMGSNYHIATHWLPSDLTVDQAAIEAMQNGTLSERLNARWAAGWRARLRWLFNREVKGQLPMEEVTLWVP